MKQIIRELGGIYFLYDSSAGPPYPANEYIVESYVGNWQPIISGGLGTNTFYLEEKIDVSGWTVDELTLFPQSIQVQRGSFYGMKTLNAVLPSGLENHREAFQELLFLTSYPIDINNWYDNLFTGGILTLSPNFANQTTSFNNVIWGQTIQYVREINTPAGGDFMTPFLIDDFSSWEPTNVDTLYAYRILAVNVSPNISPPLDDTAFLVVPDLRLVIRGTLKKEEEYANLMRMKRGYDLQQSFDVDGNRPH
jgi:hypothetical protein